MSGERKLKPSMRSYLLIFASDAWCQKLVCFIKQHCTCRFGLTKQALKDVDELLEGVTKNVHRLTLSSQALAAASPPESLLGKCIICHSLTAFGTVSEKKHQLLETSLHVHVQCIALNKACTLSVVPIKLCSSSIGGIAHCSIKQGCFACADSDVTNLERGQKLALLRRLHATMQRLSTQLRQAEAEQAAQVQDICWHVAPILVQAMSAYMLKLLCSWHIWPCSCKLLTWCAKLMQDGDSRHIVQPPQTTANTRDEDDVEDALPVSLICSGPHSAVANIPLSQSMMQ